MRALRILLIVVVILGGLFVLADRLAVGFAEDQLFGMDDMDPVRRVTAKARVDDAADDPLERKRLRDLPIGVDRSKVPFGEPPGNTIDHRHDRRVGP